MHILKCISICNLYCGQCETDTKYRKHCSWQQLPFIVGLTPLAYQVSGILSVARSSRQRRVMSWHANTSIYCWLPPSSKYAT